MSASITIRDREHLTRIMNGLSKLGLHVSTSDGDIRDCRILDEAFPPEPTHVRLPNLRLALRGERHEYIMVRVDPDRFHIINTWSHNRFDDKPLHFSDCSHYKGVELSKLRDVLPEGFYILDTWSSKS